MPAYKAPLREIKFVLYELLKPTRSRTPCPPTQRPHPKRSTPILEAAGQFCEEELQPLNHLGDEEGCHFDNGVVTTPKGFKEAYAKFVESGWPGLPCDPDYGGQGLPQTDQLRGRGDDLLGQSLLRHVSGLSNGNYNAIHAHGSERRRRSTCRSW
jgi:alkylation response protein AidB-like acyl-CoA dehydrogenase